MTSRRTWVFDVSRRRIQIDFDVLNVGFRQTVVARKWSRWGASPPPFDVGIAWTLLKFVPEPPPDGSYASSFYGSLDLSPSTLKLRLLGKLIRTIRIYVTCRKWHGVLDVTRIRVSGTDECFFLADEYSIHSYDFI